MPATPSSSGGGTGTRAPTSSCFWTLRPRTRSAHRWWTWRCGWPSRYSSPHGEGDEYLLGHPHRQVHHRWALLVRGRNVQKHELVGALVPVPPPELDGVAGIAKPDEVDPLHHPAVLDVQARDQANRPQIGSFRRIRTFASSVERTFSMGRTSNCAPKYSTSTLGGISPASHAALAASPST